MNTKHTPGPWQAKYTSGAGLSVHANVSKALGPRYSNDCPVYHLGTDSTGLSIAYELWTQFPRAEWDAMQQANARLIAAAPELLDALVDVMFQHVPFSNKADYAERARAAIAKATGGEA